LRKILCLLFSAVILSGCATYKFQKPDASSQGYLVYYDGTPVAEYTVGKEKSLPELSLAKERFKRRRVTVERYCKQMGQIESRLKEFFWEPPVMIAGFIGGVLRWPFIAVADYKYNHNPAYKAKVDKSEEEKEALDTARQDSIRKKLGAYITADLAKESGQEVVPQTEASFVPVAAPEAIKEVPVATPAVESVTPVAPEPAEIKPVVEEAPVVEAPVIKEVLEPPVAVITATPLKGYSPLKVNFSAAKSRSKSGKIVSYLWDFGDGDTSTKKNSENTYWSTTFGSRSFTVTLSVKDQAGSVSSITSSIEVITR